MSRLALFLAVILTCPVALAAGIPPSNVLAHGDSDHFWVAQIEQAPGAPASQQTTIYFRVLAQSNHWQQLAKIPARVVDLSSQGSQAGLLLEDGSWMQVYPDRSVYSAGSLPEPARMVTLAGGRDGWWAVGVVPGGIAALPHPATQPTSATRASRTRLQITAASQPVSRENRLVLFWLPGNDWTPVSELPGGAPPAGPDVSLVLVDQVPYVAQLDPGHGLRVQHLAERRWVDDLNAPELVDAAAFKLLAEGSQPLLWAARHSGRDLLYILGPSGSRVLNLAPIPGSTPAQRNLAVAIGGLRMVGSVRGALLEEVFALGSGNSEGPASPLPLPRPSPMELLRKVQLGIVMAALLAAMLGSIRQRPGMRQIAASLRQITLAPLGRRLAAGLIDAAPVAVAVAVVSTRFPPTSSASGDSELVVLWITYWSAALFYVLYTTLIESLTGRSIGKMLLKLRVVSLDAQPAKPAALVIRNVLRLVDVGLFFGPVLMILFFPLRQRAGDVAAGTLVVTADSGPGDSNQPQESQESVDSRK